MNNPGSIHIVQNGRIQKPYQTILFISDEHRGAEISEFRKYRKFILDQIRGVDIVAFVGDNAELFLIDKHHMDDQIEDYAKLLDDVAGKGKKHWRREIEPDKTDLKHGIKAILNGEVAFYRNLLAQNPRLTVLKLFGNHDTEETFIEETAKLVDEFPGRFECSIEAIKKGKVLILHGHHHHYKKSAAQWPIPNLDAAHKYKEWAPLAYNPWIQEIFAAYESYSLSPKNMAKKVNKWLDRWHGTGEYNYVENGVCKPFAWGDIEDVVNGHTHRKKLRFERDGIRHHDTGAVVYRKRVKTEDMAGIFKARLYSDGKLDDIEEIRLVKDKHHHRSS